MSGHKIETTVYPTITQKIIKSLSITLFVILFTAVLVECVLRISMTFPWTSPLHISDPDIGYRMRPNTVYGNETLNDGGFNDIGHISRKPEGVTRLSIIGDSFVFGVVPRPANFSAVVQRLADNSGKKLEVLNMGIPGSGPTNYLGMIGKDAVDKQADTVVVMLYLGNDLLQAHPDFETKLWLGSPHEVLAHPYLVGGSLKYLTIYRTFQAAKRLWRERHHNKQEGAFAKESFLEIERQQADFFEASPSGFVRDSYSALIEITQQMKETASQHGMKLMIVLAPDAIQVSPALQAEVMETFGLNPAQYDFNGLPRKLAQDLEAQGIPVLDLTPAFQASEAKSTLYAKQDTHWNEAGNQLAGEAIWSFINQQH